MELKKAKYIVEVMGGFTYETMDGFVRPLIGEIRWFKKYADAKAFYRAVKKEKKNAVHFYRNNELITFKGE